MSVRPGRSVESLVSVSRAGESNGADDGLDAVRGRYGCSGVGDESNKTVLFLAKVPHILSSTYRKIDPPKPIAESFFAPKRTP